MLLKSKQFMKRNRALGSMRILAIETSHDDTSVVLYDSGKVLKDYSISQTSFHKKFGGTVPEYASRLHAENLPRILADVLNDYDLKTIHHIAYTSHPGLVGSLQMGYVFASALSIALQKPLREVNHLHAHVFAAEFTRQIVYPALALVVSGGHTVIYFLKSPHDINLIAKTSDDAAGEVFDKVGRALKIGYPGGPAIDRAAQANKSALISFKIPADLDLNLSFSGLKTKVTSYISSHRAALNATEVNRVAASFQESITDYLISKMKVAIAHYKPRSIVLGGGVAANSVLRQKFSKIHPHAIICDPAYTTDNAAMIAITSEILQKA